MYRMGRGLAQLPYNSAQAQLYWKIEYEHGYGIVYEDDI